MSSDFSEQVSELWFFKRKQINWEQERSLIQKISHELLDTIISEMAQEIEV